MSIIIRAATVQRPGDIAAVRVGHWCGGITLVPEHLAAEHSLAATPIYLDHDDLLCLLVYMNGEAAVEYLDAETVAHYQRKLEGRDRPGDYAIRRGDVHDQVMSHWDCQP